MAKETDIKQADVVEETVTGVQSLLKDKDLELLKILSAVKTKEEDVFNSFKAVTDLELTLANALEKKVLTEALSAEGVTIVMDKWGNKHLLKLDDAFNSLTKLLEKLYASITSDKDDTDYTMYTALLDLFKIN